jgi:hypothetical protein
VKASLVRLPQDQTCFHSRSAQRNSHYRTIGTICINRDGPAPGGHSSLRACGRLHQRYCRRPRCGNTTYPWGIGVFDVDPARFPGDKTTRTFTYYHASAWSGSGTYPTPVEFDTFTATRTRSDGFGWRRRTAK